MDASGTKRPIGKFCSSNTVIIVRPTKPVAPATATVNDFLIISL
jgi:hypothetical protein